MLRVCVVKVEADRVDVLSDTIHFQFGLMHYDLRVRASCCVDLACHCLLFKEWPFSYTDADFHLGAAHVVQSRWNFCALLLNK